MQLYYWIARLTVLAAVVLASLGGGWKWDSCLP
jgi:hypothetical protein